MRRSLLFLPGNNPGNVQFGSVFGADGIILDLEDAVSPLEKDAARELVAYALKNIDYHNSEKIVRINPLEVNGELDIAAIVPCQPDVLMLPKSETVETLLVQIELIIKAEKKGQKPVMVMPLLETPLGIANAAKLATAHERVTALCFGAEDYTSALGTARTKAGQEIFVARSLVVNAAAAANIDSIDTPFTDIQDETGLINDTLLAKGLGFKGKLSINPRQIDNIHKAYTPTDKEINWAKMVISAIEKGKLKGSGVIAVDGKMVDAPIVARANRTLELARSLNLYEEDEV